MIGQEDFDRDARIFARGREAGVEAVIQLLAADAYTRSLNNGHWDTFPDRFKDERAWLGEKIALAHTELSEVIDHSRKKEDPADRVASMIGELGDCIWRCLDMAYVLNQYDALHVEDQLGRQMMVQAANMPLRGHFHGKRW